MSTTTVFANELEAHVDLIEKVAELLSAHPAGADFRLMVAPTDLNVLPGEVLVRTVDESGRRATVIAKPLVELAPDDLLDGAEEISTDDSSIVYLKTLRAASCLIRYDVRKNKVHIYE